MIYEYAIIPHYAADGGDGNHWRAVSVFYQCPLRRIPMYDVENMAILTETEWMGYIGYYESQPTVMVDFVELMGSGVDPAFYPVRKNGPGSALLALTIFSLVFGTLIKNRSIFYVVILCGIIRIVISGKIYSCENYQRLLLAGGIPSLAGFLSAARHNTNRIITESMDCSLGNLCVTPLVCIGVLCPSSVFCSNATIFQFFGDISFGFVPHPCF